MLAILRSVGVAANATRVTASAGPNARQTQLDANDFGDPSPYEGGLSPVFFSDSPQFVRFARPMRDGSDANYQDVWSSGSNGAVYLDVYTSGRVLHPVVKAATTSTKPGRAVAFSVSFQGYQPNGTMYAWTFGDGRSSAAAAPSHVWTAGGSSFSVNLTVQGAGGAAGTAAPVVVRVGKAPPKTKQHKPGTGTGGSHQPVTGPSSGHGNGSGSSSSTSGSSSTGTTPAPTPAASASPAPAPAPTPSPSAAPTPRPGRPAAGQRVQGVLLVADTSQAGALAPQQTTLTPRPAAAARAVGTTSPDRRLLWALLVPALLGLGALSQARWLARRLPVPAWRRL